MRASAWAPPGKAEGGTGRPPPQKKKKNNRGGRGGGAKTAHRHQTARQHHQRRPNPAPEGTEDRTPKEAQGDHPVKTGNTKPGTAAHWEKGHRNKQTHTTKKNKRQQPSLKERGWGDRDHKARDRDTQQKKKRKKHTPTTQPRRAGHSRDPGPAHTPTPHARTGNGGGQAGRPRNDTRPISRPNQNPNHEHHKQPTLEGQHHKPCPNTPTGGVNKTHTQPRTGPKHKGRTTVGTQCPQPGH